MSRASQTRHWLTGAAFATACATMTPANAAVIVDAMGDTYAQPVHAGWDGRSNDLISILNRGWTDPVTQQVTPLTRPDGSPLVIGDVLLGQNPITSDQTSIQRFHVTESPATFTLTYFEGHAGYSNTFGFYTYDTLNEPSAPPTNRTGLLTHHVNAQGTQATFTIDAGQTFGFYLDADGHKNSKGLYFSENRFNSDNTVAGFATDHFLILETNVGLLLAVEDLPYNPSTGLMGDQDYNDMILGLLTLSGGTPIPIDPPPTNPVPEPASVALLAIGTYLIAGGRRSRKPRK